jgi:hypothetical protein
MKLKPGDVLLDYEGDLVLVVESESDDSGVRVVHLTSGQNTGENSVPKLWSMYNKLRGTEEFLDPDERYSTDPYTILGNLSSTFLEIRNELLKKK